MDFMAQHAIQTPILAIFDLKKPFKMTKKTLPYKEYKNYPVVNFLGNHTFFIKSPAKNTIIGGVLLL
jgi:hypothetical protein